MPKGDIWWDILNQDPYQAYVAFSDQWGFGKQRSYYERAFSRVHSDYLSELGKMMRQGQTPTEDFASWLDRYNFASEWASLPPILAGRTGLSAFRPVLRWFI